MKISSSEGALLWMYQDVPGLELQIPSNVLGRIFGGRARVFWLSFAEEVLENLEKTKALLVSTGGAHHTKLVEKGLSL